MFSERDKAELRAVGVNPDLIEEVLEGITKTLTLHAALKDAFLSFYHRDEDFHLVFRLAMIRGEEPNYTSAVMRCEFSDDIEGALVDLLRLPVEEVRRGMKVGLAAQDRQTYAQSVLETYLIRRLP